jgi:hypothetical protein
MEMGPVLLLTVSHGLRHILQAAHGFPTVVENAGRTVTAIDERPVGPGHENGDLMSTNRAGRSSQVGEGWLELYRFLGAVGLFEPFLVQTAENGLAWLILVAIHVQFSSRCDFVFFFRDISLKGKPEYLIGF